MVACGPGCNRSPSPQAAFDHAYRVFLRGHLNEAQDEARQGRQRFEHSNPAWSWKFRALEAESLLLRGMSQEALTLLQPQIGPPLDRNVSVETLAIQGVAYARLHQFPEADRSLEEADQLCAEVPEPSCGKVIRAQGVLAIERGQLDPARAFFEKSLSFGRAHGDQFLEATALLNLGAYALDEGHFDEAVDWTNDAYRAATAIDAASISTKALGNLGWAYYNLGDSERSLELFQEAEKRSAQLGDIFDQENTLTNIGYVYLDQQKFDLAGQSFRHALELAETLKARQDTYNALRVLARLALQTGDLEKATQYANRALEIARESGNHSDELYPVLVQGQIAAERGNGAKAEKTFQQVERDKLCPVFLKWVAEHSLAKLYEDQKREDRADRQYRAALATFEAARASVRHEDAQLSFLTNAARMYDDYVHFLVARRRTGDALRWADYSRARTLAVGLGLLRKGAPNHTLAAPPAPNVHTLSGRMKGTLLFYWLGEKQSYLWAITPQTTELFPLPPGPEIDAAGQRYRAALAGPEDVLESPNEDGRWLYRTLVAPARGLLGGCAPDSTAVRGKPRPRPARAGYHHPSTSLRAGCRQGAGATSAKVFIIPDGSLNNLNFETLIVSEPKSHYFIEDATITDASSLRMLAAYSSPQRHGRRLLLMGDSVAPSGEYPELPKAAMQMESVARHFPPGERHIFAREQATPAAYLNSHLEQFSYIHFVAHGTASRLSPLDSAIVLSRGTAGDDSFKLYARDIIRHPLRADLVTISACYGAGERAYSGEGLVGLSWAFLRAGAHHVIAALWEATDVSTEQLMAGFYGALDNGASPDAALRSAKLALLHGTGFHKPFYWAPFQLYAGS